MLGNCLYFGRERAVGGKVVTPRIGRGREAAEKRQLHEKQIQPKRDSGDRSRKRAYLSYGRSTYGGDGSSVWQATGDGRGGSVLVHSAVDDACPLPPICCLLTTTHEWSTCSIQALHKIGEKALASPKLYNSAVNNRGGGRVWAPFWAQPSFLKQAAL